MATEMGFNPECCPICKEHTMITVFAFDRRGSPDQVFIDSLKIKLLTKAVQNEQA